MPYKGWKSISVREEVAERLTEIAEQTHRTVPKLIEHMLDKLYPKPKAEVAA